MIPEKPPYASNDCLTFLEYLQLRTAGPGFREYVSREFERTYSATGNFVLTAEKLYTSPPHRHDPIQRKVEFANALPDKFREKKKLVARAHAMEKKETANLCQQARELQQALYSLSFYAFHFTSSARRKV